MIIAGLVSDTLSLPVAELVAGLWIVLLLMAARWRRVLIFNIPGDPLLFASEPLNLFAPRSLRASEVLKMAIEDNVGDPNPAAKIFALRSRNL